MDNNLNNGVPVAPQPAPVPQKKSHVGLIIGLIVLLLVVVGGFLAAFFLYIKPNFIDGGGSSGEEKEEDKTWSEMYATYLKKELDEDEAEIAFIDFDNDDTPEMVVSIDDRIQEIDYIKKNKVATIDVKKKATVELLYNKDTEKEEWYLVDSSYSSNNYYNLKDTVKDGELATPETFASEAAAGKKFASFEVDIDYEEVTGKTASKVTKSLAKEDGYEKGKTISDIKKEIEEANKEHKIVCLDNSNEMPITYDLTFKNNLLTNIDFIMEVDQGVTWDNATQETLKSSLKQSMGYNDLNITITNVSGTKYKIVIAFPVQEFINYMNLDVDKNALTWDTSDEFVKSFREQGATCTTE